MSDIWEEAAIKAASLMRSAAQARREAAEMLEQARLLKEEANRRLARAGSWEGNARKIIEDSTAPSLDGPAQ